MRSRSAVFLGFFAFALACGCSGGTTQPVEVSGTVSYAKKPLDDGKIYFVTQGEAPEILDIKDGKFSGKVKPGKRRVEIHAFRKGAAIPKDTPGADEGVSIENYIPADYNSMSKLEADVKKEGGNSFTFDLAKK